jgi:hypothetical protein
MTDFRPNANIAGGIAWINATIEQVCARKLTAVIHFSMERANR